MRTKAKVGDSVRVYLKVDSPYRLKGGTYFHDGVICEISYLTSNNPYQKPFKNGYVMLTGNYILRRNGRFLRSTKRKISLDSIQRIVVQKPEMREHP